MGKISGFFLAFLLATAMFAAIFLFIDEWSAEDAYNRTIEPKYQDVFDNVTNAREEVSNITDPIAQSLQESSGNSIIENAFLTLEILSILKIPLTMFSLGTNLLSQVFLVFGVPGLIVGVIITILVIGVIFMVINSFRGGEV